MKSLATLFLVLVIAAAKAQNPQTVVDNKVHKMVMQFTVGDSTEQVAIVTQVGNVLAAWPKAQIEVVCHSSGLNVITANKSKVGKAISDLSAKGVVFAACNNTMRRLKLSKEDLLPTAVIVPSAFVEIVTKQEEGWAYLKGAH
jgi:intracellular sulfur oxidation DsrE/DsrF family protein